MGTYSTFYRLKRSEFQNLLVRNFFCVASQISMNSQCIVSWWSSRLYIAQLAKCSTCKLNSRYFVKTWQPKTRNIKKLTLAYRGFENRTFKIRTFWRLVFECSGFHMVVTMVPTIWKPTIQKQDYLISLDICSVKKNHVFILNGLG